MSPGLIDMGPDPALARVRTAVRRYLSAYAPEGPLAVACSGGTDSLALVAATIHCVGRDGRPVQGLVVDHGLQPDSAEVAARAAATARDLGCSQVRVLTATVHGPGGVEAAARRARYALLRHAAPTGAPVLLGHTLDDQAETVLLGLGRGSGPRSIAGMRPHDPPWGRPLLGVRRTTTAAACAALGLQPWTDPHNLDPAFRRARLRAEVLPLLEDVLAGGVAEALARTAAQLAEDGDVLDELAAQLHRRARAGGDEWLDVELLATAPAALRRRALRAWLHAAGVPDLTDAHLRAVDDLVGRWRGQGAVALPGGFDAHRAHGMLMVRRSPRRARSGPNRPDA